MSTLKRGGKTLYELEKMFHKYSIIQGGVRKQF